MSSSISAVSRERNHSQHVRTRDYTLQHTFTSEINTREPIPFSISETYRNILGQIEKHDGFASKILKRYGVTISRVNIDLEPVANNDIAKPEPVDVTYIRKVRSEDSHIKNIIQRVAPGIVQMRGWGKEGGWYGSAAIVDLAQVFPGEKFLPGSYGVITNNHVTPRKGTKYLTITLANGKVIKNVKVLQSKNGKTTTQDEITDVSIIIIQSATPLTTIEIAKEPPQKGDTVLAVGHPLGLPKASFTRGIVSHGSQETGQPIYVIQHDAEINPGNSGGPLINMAGQYVGPNSFTFSNTNGLSFAIPIQKQLQVLRDIYKYGEHVRGDLGFSVAAFTTYDRVQNNFPLNLPAAKIDWVNHDSKAYALGLRPKDVITQIVANNGSTFDIDIDNPFEITRFLSWMHNQKPNTIVHMIVYKKSTVDGKIKYTPETVELKVSKLKTERKSIKSDTWGFVVQMTSQGLPIITHVEPGSPAERAGLKPFSVVLVSVAAPQISDKPMVVDDLNKLKRMLIMLRESEAENLLLIALDINNRKKVINITLSRKEAKAPITEPVAKFNSHKRGAETYIAA